MIESVMGSGIDRDRGVMSRSLQAFHVIAAVGHRIPHISFAVEDTDRCYADIKLFFKLKVARRKKGRWTASVALSDP